MCDEVCINVRHFFLNEWYIRLWRHYNAIYIVWLWLTPIHLSRLDAREVYPVMHVWIKVSHLKQSCWKLQSCCQSIKVDPQRLLPTLLISVKSRDWRWPELNLKSGRQLWAVLTRQRISSLSKFEEFEWINIPTAPNPTNRLNFISFLHLYAHSCYWPGYQARGDGENVAARTFNCVIRVNSTRTTTSVVPQNNNWL